VLQLEATQRLAEGFVDLTALTNALALEPGLTTASELLSEVRGERLAKERSRQRFAGLLAAILLAISATLLIRDARMRTRSLAHGG
jgi:hypothetical protein